MRHRLLTLTSVLVIFTLVLPSGMVATQARSAAKGAEAQAASGSNLIYLPLVGSGLSPVIPDTTVPLSAESTDNLTISPDGATFTFAAETGELQKVDQGDVIVADVSAAAPDGFLRKVTSVQDQAGQVVLETQEATLEDAIQDGALDSSQALDPADVSSTDLEPGVSLLNALSCPVNSFGYSLDKVLYSSEYGDVTATGDICFSTTFNFSLKISNFSLEKLSITNTSTESTSLTISSTVEYSGGVEVQIARIKLKSITFWVGTLPVVIKPALTVYVGLDGSVRASISTGISQAASLTAGLKYASGTGWGPVWEFSNDFSYTPPTPTLEMSLKAYAGIKLELMLYGVVGPYVKLQVYLELAVKPLENPWWSLDAGLEVPAGVEMKIFKHEIVDYETTVFDHKWRLMPPDPSEDPSPANGATQQAADTHLTWTNPHSSRWNYLGPTLTFDVYLEAGDTTPDVQVSSGQTEYTYDPAWLESETQYYWQIITRGALGISTDGPVWSFTTEKSGMVYIPAGEFQMGCDPLHNTGVTCDLWELPLHPVYLDAYYIGETEVTNAQYALCVAAGACTPPVDNSSYTRAAYYGEPAYADYPVVYVDQSQSNAYCMWTGGRLPSEAEWEKAARGSSGPRAFPWGDQPGDCNLANFDDCTGDTSPVGSNPSGASPYGVLDMAGNVWEWVNDWYSNDYYTVSPYENPTGPESGSYKVMRGGAFYKSLMSPYNSNILVRTAHRAYGYGVDYAHGFRCAVPAETTYELEYLSGSGQTYAGSGMPFPMVFKIKNPVTGTYATQLSELGLSLVASASVGYQDMEFNNANNYGGQGLEGFGGYYYVPPNTGPAYTLEITVTLSLDGVPLDTYLVTENILGY